jgi:hypothetical protein
MANPAGGGIANAGARVGVGLGLGSLVGQFGGGKYNQTGAMIGASIGSIIPGLGTLVGALVGAVVGLIAGALASPNTETHLRAAFDNMLGNVTGKWVTKKGGGLEDGEWVGGLGAPTSDIERDARDVFEVQGGRFFDLLRLGAKDKAAELFAAYQKTLRDSLAGARIDIAAGSDADIQKDTEVFLKKMLPRITLAAMFGQTGNLPAFDRDAPGGIPGIDWNAPNLDLTKLLFDPEAPIPAMLRDLGVIPQKIADLAAMIPYEDPEKILAYIEGLVGVLLEFERLGTAMGKTVEETWATFSEEASTSAAAGFGGAAQDIADLFDVLGTYSGDVQLQKTKEAQALSSQLWESVLEYLRKLQIAVEKMSASIQAQRGAMRDFLRPLGEEEANSSQWGAIAGVWGRIRNAVDPAVVEAAVAEAQEAIDALFRTMAERVTRGKALLERLSGLGGKLGSISGSVASEAFAAENPLAAWGSEVVGISALVSAAAQKSGLDQIAAIEGVADSAETMYGNLKTFLADIASTSASINKSIDSQIWELGVGEMDATGQADAITQRVKELQEELKAATSPAEIAAITAEIQSLTNRYVGTFGKDDVKREEAIAWAQEQLERARGLAQTTLDVLRERAEAMAQELETTLATATGLISGNVTEASSVIGQLSFTLGELDRVMRDAMERLGQGALDSLEPLRTAMEGAAEIFKGATQDAANALTAPTGLDPALEQTTARMNVLSDAAGRAATNLERLAAVGGGGTPQVSQNVTQASSSRTSSAQIVSTVRRYSRSLTPRVA